MNNDQTSATVVDMNPGNSIKTEPLVGTPPAARTARRKRVKLGIVEQLVNARKNLKEIGAAVSFEHRKFPVAKDGQRETRFDIWFKEDSTEPNFGIDTHDDSDPEGLILYAQEALGYTVCRLDYPNGASATTISICSAKDRYNGKIGEMVSLKRALNALSQPRKVVQQIFHKG